MKHIYKFTILLFSLFSFFTNLHAGITIDGKDYEVDTISQREIGPGIIYTRYRIPDYPLNINTIKMDLNNPYNRMETTQANDRLGSTERLADAYVRHSLEGKNPIAGANASFWCVSSEKPASDYVLGTPYGGSVYNGKIVTETNMYANKWDGGPEWSGMVGVDKNKNLWIDQLSWKGYAKNPKWSETPEIFQVNRMCNDNELVMFNSFYGTDRKFNTTDANTEVLFKLKEGETWGVNKEITGIVQEIIPDKGQNTLKEYDFCLSGTGIYKTKLEQLSIGDEVSISYKWTTLDTKETPDIENIVEGQALILKNGDITHLNEKGYCNMTYSRTAYGSSADKKTLFMIVVDMSLNEYGNSSGCNTSVVSQILQQMGCSNLCSMDAGGSAQMMVLGNVVNKTTEGNPRATANGMFLYSTAPRSSEIARIEFDEYKLQMPVNGTFTPKILGYNQYGDLIDTDVKGFTLSCDETLGYTEGNSIVANSTPSYGLITATYNGISVNKPLTTMNSEMYIRIKPSILIDGVREYPIEVNSVIGRNTYGYNPAHLSWDIDNPDIINIDNGILKGIKEGSTKIKCSLGEFSDETEVKVEIADKQILSQSWDGWTLKATGAKNLNLSEEGKLSMNYTGGRGANIKLSKNILFYSLPDKITLEFMSTIPLSYIQTDFRSKNMSSANYISFGKEDGGFEANKKYTLELKISDLGDPNDMKLYPLSLRELIFYPATSGVTTGENSLTFYGLNAQYNNFSSVENISTDKQNKYSVSIYPNPVTDGNLNINITGDEYSEAAIINQAGTVVSVHKLRNGINEVNVSNLQNGFYLIRIKTSCSTETKKLIIK